MAEIPLSRQAKQGVTHQRTTGEYLGRLTDNLFPIIIFY
jgi:hypothetical protein